MKEKKIERETNIGSKKRKEMREGKRKGGRELEGEKERELEVEREINVKRGGKQ